MATRDNWNRHDDQQWSSSRLVKNGNRWFDQEQSNVFTWALEVRSEFVEAGTVRIGELFITRNMKTGEMTCSIAEEQLS